MQVAFAHTNLGVLLVLLALRRYGTGGLLIILRGLEDCEGCADGLGAPYTKMGAGAFGMGMLLHPRTRQRT